MANINWYTKGRNAPPSSHKYGYPNVYISEYTKKGEVIGVSIFFREASYAHKNCAYCKVGVISDSQVASRLYFYFTDVDSSDAWKIQKLHNYGTLFIKVAVKDSGERSKFHKFVRRRAYKLLWDDESGLYYIEYEI